MNDYEKMFEGYDVPSRLKETAISIMRRFTITGEGDGMYICNVIAAESGIGDGEGHFTGDEIFNRSEIARRLQFAYGSNIPSSAIPELVRILYTGHIDRKDALEGIAEQNLRWKRERANCKEDWRKDYLSKLIQESRQTFMQILEEIKKEYKIDEEIHF